METKKENLDSIGPSGQQLELISQKNGVIHFIWFICIKSLELSSNKKNNLSIGSDVSVGLLLNCVHYWVVFSDRLVNWFAQYTRFGL
jgi:hypothetical protein